MKLKNASIISLLFVVIFAYSINTKYTAGSIDTTNDFFYLGKFTYSNNGIGSMTVETSNVAPIDDAENQLIQVSLYNNDESSPWYWPNIWGNDELTCQEKFDLQYPVYDGAGASLNNNKIVIDVKDSNIFTWYFVISDCNLGNSTLSMDIAVEWINPGNGWYKQFSVEDQDLLTIYLVFFLIWLILFPAFAFCLFHFFLKHSYELDSNLKIFCTVLIFDFISLFMYLLHYIAYAIDGVGVPGILVASDVLSSLSTMCFYILLLQIASLKKSIMDQSTIIWLLVSTMLLTYMGFFFWQEIYSGLDPQEVSYRWATIPGIIMMIIQCAFWVLFVFFCALSIKTSDRTLFIILVAIIFSAWFLILPFSVAFAELIPYYDRWKAVLGVILSFNLFAYSGICFFIFPNRFTNMINPIAFAHSKYNERLIRGNALFDESENSPYGSL